MVLGYLAVLGTLDAFARKLQKVWLWDTSFDLGSYEYDTMKALQEDALTKL